ncbi:MAG: hypothetical protein ACYTG1_13135, partial [Planctomycetota bacterium]
MPRRRLITPWNLLALAVGVIGAVATVGASHLWMLDWSRSGLRFPVAESCSVELPAGPTLVYYESPEAVPPGNVTLDLRGPDGDRVTCYAPGDGHSYHAYLSGLSGRALWRIRPEAAGTYRFSSFNANYDSTADIPDGDRIVFLKTPGTVSEARGRQKLIQIAGATSSMFLFL